MIKYGVKYCAFSETAFEKINIGFLFFNDNEPEFIYSHNRLNSIKGFLSFNKYQLLRNEKIGDSRYYQKYKNISIVKLNNNVENILHFADELSNYEKSSKLNLFNDLQKDISNDDIIKEFESRKSILLRDTNMNSLLKIAAESKDSIPIPLTQYFNNN